MKITQVRNATLIVEFAGLRFLIDPMLAPKGSFPAFAGTLNSDRSNPLVDLPVAIDELVDVDAVIVTHMHRDHWDDTAKESLPKSLPLFVQDERDAAAMQAAGFTSVRILSDHGGFEDVSLTKTAGQHGSDEAMEKIGARLGSVCGVVMRHPEEKTLYIAGDTIWNEHVAAALRTHAPDVIVLNCGDARINGVGSIIMGQHDVLEVCRAAPNAMVVASHMEAVNHAMLSRHALRLFLEETGLAARVLVPADGETIAA
ncbi:MBL fold metallo-hydrolase [uncultured Alsobacter sp.]|uniref:MBL fold metallo-hydrolase n=1 Tax=uncultured Alsobacter sp. TaxID=1748258 RepID=UPI0025DA6AAE|nr:MBL fold metallo-hydrolase [uncultured Alsobacter sp.]